MRWPISLPPSRRGGLLLAVLLAGAAALAADFRPTVGPGATKEEAITAYGWPTGQSQAGTKEILSYPQGKITLENGRVERVDFSTTQPWPAPRPRPGPPTASTAKSRPEAPVDFWLTNFDEAVREAKRGNARILVLFTGSDWSPASRQFQEEIEFHPDFINVVAGSFVLLRLDFPTRAAQPAELRQQNAELRARYGVMTYPSLLVLNPAGQVVGQVDLGKIRDDQPYRTQVIAALREVKSLLAAAVPLPAPPAEPAPATGAENKSSLPAHVQAVKESLQSAGWLLTGGILGGLVLAGLMLWWLWRARGQRTGGPISAMSSRIGDAAAGVPSGAELRRWPLDKVRRLAAALAEAEGYAVATRAGGSDPDLALTRRSEPKPRVLVCCVAGHAGPLPARRVRELAGSMAVENVPVGWFVAPAGFSADARTAAAQNGVQLLDSEALISLLRDLPPLILPKVIAAVSANKPAG